MSKKAKTKRTMAKKTAAAPNAGDNEEQTFEGNADLDNLFNLLADEEEDKDELKLKQELLVRFEAEAANVGLNDINPEVRSQYNSANALFVLCFLIMCLMHFVASKLVVD